MGGKTRFNNHAKCFYCKKEIKGNELIFVKIRYPERRGFAEIKAFLQDEGQIICEACF
ncbi:Fe3+ hydroxamate ABC transporter substrate-binding protein [Bacillus sp. B1-b2]|nr:Fe3+ hydroxamate ABC transporter substrate-binding protein [Bacillus sp. B1-b2]